MSAKKEQATTGAHPTTNSTATGRGNPPLVQIRDLKVQFPTGDRTGTLKAVDGVSFDVLPGETLGIIGESGSGKTTLGRALVGLVAPTSGVVARPGADSSLSTKDQLRSQRRDFQIVFQDPHSALNPRMRILDSVMEPLRSARAGTRAEIRQRALAALDKVGISEELALRYPHQLSGGQKQRVNIARVLTLRPKLVVCDEVVAALDVSIRGEILNLFADLQREFGLTYVFITHDLSVVSHISDRIAVTYLGRIVELGPNDGVSGAPMHPYTAALLSAEPVALPSRLRAARRIVLEGEVPSPINPPSGCRFRTRCPAVRDRCSKEEPEFRELRPNHWVACHFAASAAAP
jgi:peptide/nickel transport system ATP-binding protein/oligopeptide transport system ATP-binding protein